MKDGRAIKCFLLDLDGTLYLSDNVINGAVCTVAGMRKQGRVMFLTNNTSLPTSCYFAKLTAMGFAPQPHEIYGAGSATVDYLQRYFAGKRVYLLGSEQLKAEFSSQGVCIVESKPDVAVFAFDKTLTYQKFADFCGFVSSGAVFIATHPDLTCPTASGFIPDVGAFLAAVRAATGRTPDAICGKPSAEFGRRIVERLGLEPHEICMVGDRLSTDMRFAFDCGFRSALVLSGEAKKSDLDGMERVPDFVLDSVADWDTIR